MEDARLDLPAYGIPAPAGQGAVVPRVRRRVHQLAHVPAGGRKASGRHVEAFTAVVELPHERYIAGISRYMTPHV